MRINISIKREKRKQKEDISVQPRELSVQKLLNVTSIAFYLLQYVETLEKHISPPEGGKRSITLQRSVATRGGFVVRWQNFR